MHSKIFFTVGMLALLNIHSVVRNGSTWEYDFHSLVMINVLNCIFLLNFKLN